MKELEAAEQDKKRRGAERQDRMAKFFEELGKSRDLKDKLDDLAEFLQEHTGPSTGVYIGKLERPRRAIGDADDDKAHVDREGQRLIRFQYASKGHEFMKGKLLRPDQGITHTVFQEAAPAEEAPPEDAEEGGGEAKAAKQQVGDPNDIINSMKHLYIKEVVREPKIHFYKVPRLGSYMAVPIEYESCLTVAALDEAVADFATVSKAREEQQKEREEYEESQRAVREEKERAGEPMDGEERQWPVIEEKPFLSKKKRYVVCVDTLG